MFKGLWESRFLLFKQKMLMMESKKEHSHFMERANTHIGCKPQNWSVATILRICPFFSSSHLVASFLPYIKIFAKLDPRMRDKEIYVLTKNWLVNTKRIWLHIIVRVSIFLVSIFAFLRSCTNPCDIDHESEAQTLRKTRKCHKQFEKN